MSLRAVNLLAVLLAAGGGCVIVDVGVTNPIPGLSTVAIAPFFNQSQERAVDGREVALAYYAELQKVPGFQVVPVGVTEVAIREHKLQLGNPDDVLKLAAILRVDAVVVGSITDFDPYYPPRIGLTVDWYSPFPWAFRADLAGDAECRETLAKSSEDGPDSGEIDPVDRNWKRPRTVGPLRRFWRGMTDPIVRGQSADAASSQEGTASDPGWKPVDTPRVAAPADAQPAPPPLPETPLPVTSIPVATSVVAPFDPRQPLMSYTRLFDGADAEFTARLRDYLELRADLRTGSWPAALRRSDEFVRFAARLMVVEMLALHGGEGRRR
ncbi:MAG TPA: hypothetical protein VML55_09520, partial [Planctomycetaceae bacterium]|nr:hypothetical protein [Planctomycetaceae bacterium]